MINRAISFYTVQCSELFLMHITVIFDMHFLNLYLLAPKKNSKAASLSNSSVDPDIKADAQFIDNFEEFLANPQNKTSQLLIPIVKQLNYLKEKARKNVQKRIVSDRSKKLKTNEKNNSENVEPAMFGSGNVESDDEPAMFGSGNVESDDEPTIFGLGNAENDEEIQVLYSIHTSFFISFFMQIDFLLFLSLTLLKCPTPLLPCLR